MSETNTLWFDVKLGTIITNEQNETIPIPKFARLVELAQCNDIDIPFIRIQAHKMLDLALQEIDLDKRLSPARSNEEIKVL